MLDSDFRVNSPLACRTLLTHSFGAHVYRILDRFSFTRLWAWFFAVTVCYFSSATSAGVIFEMISHTAHLETRKQQPRKDMQRSYIERDYEVMPSSRCGDEMAFMHSSSPRFHREVQQLTEHLNPKLRVFTLTPESHQDWEKRWEAYIFGADTMSFSSILRAIWKSEIYLWHAQNRCRKHP